LAQDMDEKGKRQENQRKVNALAKFLGLIFGKDDYMSEVDAQECLYYVQYIKANVEACLDAQDRGEIPILECTVWATHQGKTDVTVNYNKNPEIRDSWFLSELIARLMSAINEWDSKDLGKKQGKVVDMMSRLGWVKDFGKGK